MRGLIVSMLVMLAAARPAHAKGCHETSTVVGHEHCTRFGTWSREQHVPALWVDLGFSQHRYTSEPFSLGTASLINSVASPRGPDLATTSTDPMDVRILGGLAGLFYTGLELDGGWLTTAPQSSNGVAVGASGSLEALAIAGAHVGIWRFSVGGEVAAGGRAVTLTANCGQPKCPAADSTTETRGELEMRATADVWITPHLSLGLGVGRSLTTDDDTRYMIYFGEHVRAFDGMR